MNVTLDRQGKNYTKCWWRHFCQQLSQDQVVQELSKELTVLHSIKLVKAMLQGAGALPSALLHTVHSTGLITC